MARTYCQSCHYLIMQCVCDLIPIITKTLTPPLDIFVLQHEQEAKHAKNTIKLLQLIWPSIRIMKTHDTNLSLEIVSVLESMKEQGCFYLLYPTEISQKIEELTAPVKQSIKGIVLIDATWRKSLKLLNLYPTLKQLPTLCFKQTKNSIYEIRKSPNKMALSSFEAIVHSCELLTHHKAEPMLDFMAKAQQRLWQKRPINSNE